MNGPVSTLWPAAWGTGGDPFPAGQAYEYTQDKVEFGMPVKVKCARGYELD